MTLTRRVFLVRFCVKRVRNHVQHLKVLNKKGGEVQFWEIPWYFVTSHEILEMQIKGTSYSDVTLVLQSLFSSWRCSQNESWELRLHQHYILTDHAMSSSPEAPTFFFSTLPLSKREPFQDNKILPPCKEAKIKVFFSRTLFVFSQ